LPKPRQIEIGGNTRAAVSLNGAVEDPQGTPGATTLIIANLRPGGLVPTVSIMYAAFNVNSLACSISILETAMSARIVPCSASARPNATRARTRLHIDSSAARRRRSASCSDESGPARVCLCDFESSSFAQQNIFRRHANVLEQDFGVSVEAHRRSRRP